MKPTFFGYGKTTRAIATALGGGCRFYDDNCTEPYTDAAQNSIFPSEAFDPDTSAMEILTPSIPPHHPLLQKAKNPISEYDYFLSPERDKPVTVWISGTNGKTTTTQMLTHLLAHRGALSGGNIGTPLAELDPKAPLWILESSSYTLHHTKVAAPDIYLLLPITPDHLNWHGTPEAYEADKLRPLRTMKEGALALVPEGLTLPKSDAWIVTYDSHAFLETFFDLDSTQLHYKAAFLQDALLALAVTRTLFDEADYALLNRFRLDHHRQEEIRDIHGRLWVNDSKATNVDATIQAIHAYSDSDKIHLILGGDDKGVDLSPLFDLIASRDITLYAIGRNHDTLVSLAKARQIPIHDCQTLEQAIPLVANALQANEVALLSPAASSLDQFSSYVQRGELFMQMVADLSTA